LFASSCCSDHLMRHHPEEKGAVLHLVRHMDSIFAPVVDVVGSAPPILAGIQVSSCSFRFFTGRHGVNIVCLLSFFCRPSWSMAWPWSHSSGAVEDASKPLA
jgi:hypothetical protein